MADRSPALRRLQYFVIYPLEAVLAALAYGLFRLLPPSVASDVGGWLCRTVGPRLGITRRAERNMRRALPELDDAAIAAALSEMWDNLGRVAGEFPHLDRIVRERLEVAGEEHVAPARKEGAPCIFFSGHIANWELFAPAARQLGMPYVQVYRVANNPFVDALLLRLRRLDRADMIPKGPRGARGAVETLRAGRRLGMLVDQKLNDGIAVPLFGRDAMTAPALAQLALRYDCPIIPVRLERIARCRFRLTIHPSIPLPRTGNQQRDVAAIMAAVNRRLEDWIRDRPGQWLWLHRRWPED